MVVMLAQVDYKELEGRAAQVVVPTRTRGGHAAKKPEKESCE